MTDDVLWNAVTVAAAAIQSDWEEAISRGDEGKRIRCFAELLGLVRVVCAVDASDDPDLRAVQIRAAHHLEQGEALLEE